MRPAVDGRFLNEKCNLIHADMPTYEDFDDFLSSEDILMTTADFKNCFDTYPLHEDDQKYAVIMTLLGLRKMKCMTYGWMNSAPVVQIHMNKICVILGNIVIYIDDLVMKTFLYWSLTQVLNQFENLFIICDKYNMQLHPSKFWPLVSEVTTIGIRRLMYGHTITKQYQSKVLGLVKPQTKPEMATALGVLNYISRYLFNYHIWSYWLYQLIKINENKRLTWTKEANCAWEIIMQLVQKAPILYKPKRIGQFALKTDACAYGIGGVLLQKQSPKEIGLGEQIEKRWIIIDFYSKIIPKTLRNAHCSLSEGLAITICCEHWLPYLLARKFIISSDHRALLSIFGSLKEFKELQQKQLLRMRMALSELNFEIQHIPGIDTMLADGISRYYVQIIEKWKINGFGVPYNSTNEKFIPLSDKEKLDLQLKLNNLKLNKINNIYTSNIINYKSSHDPHLSKLLYFVNNDNNLMLLHMSFKHNVREF
jgi:hypothetical protein